MLSYDKGLLFDVDDTLIERKDIPKELQLAGIFMIDKAIPSYNLRIPVEIMSEEWIRSHYGNSIPWYMTEFLRAAGFPLNSEDVTGKLVDIGVRNYFDRIAVTGPNNVLFNDVYENLKRVTDLGFKLAAYSNSNTSTVLSMFDRNRITKFFMCNGILAIVGGDIVKKSGRAVKEAFQMAAVNDLALSYLVGDTDLDVRAGLEAGLEPTHIIRLNRNEQPVSHIPNIRTLNNLIEFL